MFYRNDVDPEVLDRIKEIAMESDLRIEKNPVFTIIFDRGKAEGEAVGKAEGKAEGEARGILIGKAMSHDAPDAVIRHIREWNAHSLRELEEQVEAAIRENDWSGFMDARPRI